MEEISQYLWVFFISSAVRGQRGGATNRSYKYYYVCQVTCELWTIFSINVSIMTFVEHSGYIQVNFCLFKVKNVWATVKMTVVIISSCNNYSESLHATWWSLPWCPNMAEPASTAFLYPRVKKKAARPVAVWDFNSLSTKKQQIS
jgi:hypothetical protein